MRYVRGTVVDFLLKTLQYVESIDFNICYCISRYKIYYRQNWSTYEFFLIKLIILNFSKYIIFEYHIFLKDIFFSEQRWQKNNHSVSLHRLAGLRNTRAALSLIFSWPPDRNKERRQNRSDFGSLQVLIYVFVKSISPNIYVNEQMIKLQINLNKTRYMLRNCKNVETF